MAIVREAFLKDLEAIIRILDTNRQRSDVGEEDIKDFVVAEIDGTVVGCGMLFEHEDSVEIRKVSLLPVHQRKGLGKDIAQALLTRVKGRKCWLLSVDSHSFWEQFGFGILSEEEEPKEAKEYCKGCKQREDCDRVVMVREAV